MRFEDVVTRIRCPDCRGSGEVGDGPGSSAQCVRCGGSGIDPDVVDEASGWGTWAISVHDSPGWIVVVPLGLNDPTGKAVAEEPWKDLTV